MSGFLLDTNVPSELVRPQPEPRVRTWVAAQDLDTLFMSAVSFGEIRRGIILRRQARDGFLDPVFLPHSAADAIHRGAVGRSGWATATRGTPAQCTRWPDRGHGSRTRPHPSDAQCDGFRQSRRRSVKPMAGSLTTGAIPAPAGPCFRWRFRVDAQSGGCAAHGIGARSFRVGDFVKDLSKKVSERRKCQQKAQTQQDQRSRIDTPYGDCLIAPTPFQNPPGEQPDQDGRRGYAREPPCRFIESKTSCEIRRLIRGDGQHCQSEGSNTGRKNGGCAGTVRQGRHVGRCGMIWRIHFSSPRLS